MYTHLHINIEVIHNIDCCTLANQSEYDNALKYIDLFDAQPFEYI